MAVPALRHPQFVLPPSRAKRDGHALQWYVVAGDAAEAGAVFVETRCCFFLNGSLSTALGLPL